MISISPKTAIWINAGVAVLGAIAAAGPKIFPSYIPDEYASDIVQTAGFVVAIYGAASAAMHGFSSSAPGPLAPPDPKIVQAVADGASPRAVLTIAERNVTASPAPDAPTNPNAPLQPKGT